MGRPVHKWETTFTRGTHYEEELDSIFARWYEIEPVSQADQSAGIDRVFTSPDGREFTIEYKSDSRAAETGNAFIETLSVSTTGRLGWAYTSRAQVLVYYVPELSIAYLVNMVDVKRSLTGWRGACREASAQNEGYEARGLLVPLLELARVAFEVLDVGVSRT